MHNLGYYKSFAVFGACTVIPFFAIFQITKRMYNINDPAVKIVDSRSSETVLNDIQSKIRAKYDYKITVKG